MKREEPMKNLWIDSGLLAKCLLIHKSQLSSGRFIPISNHGQHLDPSAHSEVIPLPAVSY